MSSAVIVMPQVRKIDDARESDLARARLFFSIFSNAGETKCFSIVRISGFRIYAKSRP